MLRRAMMAGGSGSIAGSIVSKLKLWWTFDNTMTDSVASLTLSPAGTYSAGMKSNCVETVRSSTGATGISGYEASGFSLFGWIYLTSSSSRILLGFSNNRSGGEVIPIDHVSGGIGMNYGNSAGFSSIGRIAAANNTWHFFESSWIPGSGSTGTVRASLNNGTPLTATKDKGTEVAHSFFQLGSIYSYTSSGCNLDEVGFCQGALTAEEISYLYNSGSGKSYAELLSDA